MKKSMRAGKLLSFFVMLNAFVFFGFLNVQADVVSGTGSISGKVVKYSDKTPLQNVNVILFQGVDKNIAKQNAWEYVASVVTDSNGNYQFTNLEQRRYHIQINTGTMSAGIHYVEADLYDVQVFASINTPGMNFELREAGLIYGYVTSATDGSTIPYIDALIRDSSWGDNFRDWHETRSINGRYDLWMLPSQGKFYPVSIRAALNPGKTYTVYGGNAPLGGKDGCYPQNYGYTLLGSAAGTATFTGSYSYYFILADYGNLIKVDSVLGPGGIFCNVVDSYNVNSVGYIWGNPDGNFASLGLQNYEYSDWAQKGYVLVKPAAVSTGIVVTIVNDGRPNMPIFYEAKWNGDFSKASFSQNTRVDFVLEEAGAITGRVVNESGEGIEGIRISGHWNKYNEAVAPKTDTDRYGYYTLHYLPPGNNYIYLDIGDSRKILQAGVKYNAGEAYRGPVNLAAAETKTAEPFVVYQAGMVTGMVTDQAGLPVVGVNVDIDGNDVAGNYFDSEDVVTDAFGQYTIDYVAPGNYYIQFTKEEFLYKIVADVAVSRGGHVTKNVVLKPAVEASVSGVITNYSLLAYHDSDGTQFPYYQDADYESEGVPFFGLLALPADRDYDDEDFLNVDKFFVGMTEASHIEDGYKNYFEPAGSAETLGKYNMALPYGSVSLGMYKGVDVAPGWGEFIILHDWKQFVFSSSDSLGNVNFTAGTGPVGILKGSISVPAGYNNFSESWCVIYAFNEESGAASKIGDALAFVGWTQSYEIRELPIGTYTLKAYARNLPSVIYSSVVVTASSTTIKDISFSAGGALSGAVTDGATSLPVAGALVKISETGRHTVSDTTGNYTITGINTGNYTVKVSTLGYADTNSAVSVVANSVTSQNFVLNSNVGSINGTLKDQGNNNIDGATILAYNETNGIYHTADTVAGKFFIGDLTPGSYLLAINTQVYGTLVYPTDAARIELLAQENITGIAIVAVEPQPPLFTVNSSAAGANLSLTFYADRNLNAQPALTLINGSGILCPLSSNSALNRFDADYAINPSDTIVRIQIAETNPIVSGNPSVKTFTFEVTPNLVQTAGTNVTNALGGSVSMMGAQDNTKIYVPPFAIAGVSNTQALGLTIMRYGDPGDPMTSSSDTPVSAVYDFSFDTAGASVKLNHTFTVTMSFQLPNGMSHSDFESTLVIRYFDVVSQQWKTDGISNTRINWANNTIMFEVSHLTKFAAFILTKVSIETPVGLVAYDKSAKVGLRWDAATEAASYKIYRIDKESAPLASSSVNNYIDYSVTNGVTYTYMVTALDRAGNESLKSATVSAMPTAERKRR